MTYITRRQRKEKRKKKLKLIGIAIVAVAIICFVLLLFAKYKYSEINPKTMSCLEIPEYSGRAYTVINNNVPFFDEEDKNAGAFENYSKLDRLGRCGVAYANISRDLMPVEERNGIGSIKPSGWNQAKYEGIIDSEPPYLYNRCHLIAYCLTAENANERNLITATRYMNVEGMLPLEVQVAKYLDQYDNHVLYRVTPVFEDDNLVADGVLMEAYSVEDNGAGICACIYCYNVQPGVEIDYGTGKSRIRTE